MYRVIEAFSTPLRRFMAGVEIAAHEIDGVLSAEDWVELGKLEAIDRRAEARPEAELAAEEPAEEYPEPVEDPA